MSSVKDHELWSQSAEAWMSTVERDRNRTHLLDPIAIRLCGDVAGLRVLDVGAGEGRFSRMLEARGAEVVPVDPVFEFAHRAGAIMAFGESLPVRSASFDLVVSYLSLCDMREFRAALHEFVRVIKPGGRLLLIDLHPMTGVPYWVKDEHGNKLYRIVDRYFEERGERVQWSGMDVVNYHRPQSAIFQTLLGDGMRLIHFEEPYPTDESIAEVPHLADERRVPNFMVTLWDKP